MVNGVVNMDVYFRVRYSIMKDMTLVGEWYVSGEQGMVFGVKPSCGHCGLKRHPDGYDGCIGELEGNVANACCGHGGIRGPYVQFYHNDDDDFSKYLKNPNKYHIYIW